MPWVQFSRDYVYTPSRERRVSFGYKAGYRGLVKAECAAQAIAAGVATPVDPDPRRTPAVKV
jgi:hypothetical protein